MAHPQSPESALKELHQSMLSDYQDILAKKSALLNERSREFSPEQLVGLAVFLHLPDDTETRRMIIEAGEAGAPASAEVTRGIHEYLRCGAEIRGAYGRDWRDCLDNRSDSLTIPQDASDRLDAIAARVAMPLGENDTRLAAWFADAVSHGVCTSEEQEQLMSRFRSTPAPSKSKVQPPAEAPKAEKTGEDLLLSRLEALGGK